ncbi:MAG: TlpA disulfide reductase family protein [Thermoguttaceae bacterium]
MLNRSLLALMLLLPGCGGGETSGLPPIDRPGLERLVAEHRGRVVLVDFWATWCPPCQALFPHTVELARRYAGRGLAVVTVSLDAPRDEGAVRRFLADHQATATENFIAREGAAAEFEIKGGFIPCVKIYDRQGQLWTTVTGAYPDKIDRAVEELLEEK